MKHRLIILLASAVLLLAGAAAFAQTPEEIIARMEQQLNRAEQEGLAMDLVIKVPIVGELRSHNLVRGKKIRSEISAEGKEAVNWADKDLGTMWTYDISAGEVTVTNTDASDTDSQSGSKMMLGITDGYDIVLKEETSDAWVFVCNKKKSNPDKDDPKKIDLAVAKKTNLPLYFRAKKGLVTVSFEKVAIGVSENQVTFRESDCPGARIIDKR